MHGKVTLVYHVEYVANSRPISYVTQNDQYNILTPNMLIFGRDVHQENWLDPNHFHDPDYTLVSQQDLGNAFKKLRVSMSEIEKDFYTLYLDSLRERDAKQMESTQADITLALDTTSVICVVHVRSLDMVTPKSLISFFSLMVFPFGSV